MAWVQADVDALKAAIATGARAVQYADRTITYHSLSEMIDLLRLMEAEVGATTVGGAATSGRQYTVYSRKGF